MHRYRDVMTIARIPFGRTGHESSRTIFGAVALAAADERTSHATLELLLEHGVNHIDTAPSYGDSEDQLGPWLREHRDAFFLGTKTTERMRAPARESILRSLDRMGVDCIDLIQLHNLVHPGEWEIALSDGGALRAAVEARDEGLVRFIGVTGHGLTAPYQHRRALDRFAFDAVLAPYNPAIVAQGGYASDFDDLAAACAERGVALQTIKAITRGPWGAAPRHSSVWYEPLTDQDDIDVAVWWVLGREGVFLNTVGDLELLAKVLDAAERFRGCPTADDVGALLEGASITPLFVS
jgi:aryl-alcohol dehydrogenase-like predicted oxidoreductase